MKIATPAALLAMILFCPMSNASENSPAAAATPGVHHLLSHLTHYAKRPAGLPRHWDKRIPLPAGVAVKAVKPPVGAAQAVEFSTPDDYDKTVAFYKEALPKAGFQLGPEVKAPARKVHNLNFTRANVQDTLSIYPDKSDPSKMMMRIVYTPEKGWIRTHLAKWEERARVLPRWWSHHEEQKHEAKAAQSPAAQATAKSE
jgi:hypothetical protein